MRFLFECARPRPDAGGIERAVDNVTDWDAVVSDAENSGVLPLVSWYISTSPSENVPDRIRKKLSVRVSECARHSLAFSTELLKLLSRFQQSGIRIVPFKGPVLAWSLYESPALREMSDLDLLVQPCDVGRAIDLLTSLGYECPYSNDVRFFRPGREMPFFSQRTGVTVDLHWALLPPYLSRGLDLEGVWSRLTTVQIAGHAVPTLGNEDLLIYLCIHGAKHAWSSLHWLADLARVIDRLPLDWDGILSRVRAGCVSRIVFAGLILAVDLLGATVPPEIASAMRADSRAAAIAAAINNRIVNDLPAPVTTWAQLRFQLSLLERTSDRFRLLMSTLPPAPADAESLHLPAWLFPIHYAIRPIRLVAKYSISGYRRLCPWAPGV